jgi:hypothetical protein
MHVFSQVAKYFDTAYDIACMVANRRYHDLDRRTRTLFVLRKYQDWSRTRLASDDTAVQWAMLMPAQQVAILVHMFQDIVVAIPANDLISLPSSDAFSSRVPKYDSSLSVGDIGTISQ